MESGSSRDFESREQMKKKLDKELRDRLKEREAEEFYEDSDDLGESKEVTPKILPKKQVKRKQIQISPSKENPMIPALQNFPQHIDTNSDMKELTFSPNNNEVKESGGSSARIK